MIIKNKTKGLGKYKTLIISISIFIILILLLLIINLLISNKLQKNSQQINIAASQASKVQEISKDLYTIVSQYQKVLPYDDQKILLENALNEFDENFNAFSGIYKSGSNRDSLPIKIEDPRGQEILTDAKAIWNGYLINISPVFQSRNNTQSVLLNALIYSDQNNKKLSSLMNELANLIQSNSKDDVFLLRIFQISGIALAISSFIFIIFYLFKYLRKSDEKLELAQEETASILKTVREGLFLLDNSLIIGNQHSNEMNHIFETTHFSGTRFSEILKDIVSKDQISTVEDYIKLLFNPDVIEDLIGSLNPLENIMVTITENDGSQKIKYLNFAFYRVFAEDEVENVLVSVKDMTENHLLTKELEKSKEESSNRMLIIDEFLRADQSSVKRFLINTNKSLSEINQILKGDKTNVSDFRKRLDDIFVEIHRIKGESTTLGFTDFSDKSHDFESEIESIKNNKNIDGIDFLPLTIKLDELIESSNAIKNISNGLTLHTTPAASKNTDEKKENWDYIKNFSKKLAKEYDKDINLIMTGFYENNLNEGMKDIINGIIVQLIKNSIVHGIEKRQERIENGKKPEARIDIILSMLPTNTIELVVKDDGKGFDLEKIKKKLITKNKMPIDKVSKLSRSELVKTAFFTGFSTAQSIDINAGRGVGLDVIRENIRKAGGNLALNQADGKYCQFKVSLPTT